MTVVPGHHGGPREPPWTLPTNQGPPQRRRCCFDAGVDLSPQQGPGRGPEAGLSGAGTASRGRHMRPGRSRSRCTKQATRSPQERVRAPSRALLRTPFPGEPMSDDWDVPYAPYLASPRVALPESVRVVASLAFPILTMAPCWSWFAHWGTAQPQPAACCRGPAGRDPQPLGPSDRGHQQPSSAP